MGAGALRALERAVILTARLLPARKAELARALLTEVDSMPAEDRLSWALGGLAFVTREIVRELMRPALYVGAVAGATAALVYIDRSPSDVSNQATVLILLLEAGALGMVAPRWAWLSGLLVGAAVATAHAVYLVAGLPLPYPMSPAGWAGAATLLALVVPGMAGAYGGAGIIGAIRRRRAP
jgi:hypothetical protein